MCVQLVKVKHQQDKQHLEQVTQLLATNLWLQYHPWIKQEGVTRKKGNDHQLKKLWLLDKFSLSAP